MSTWSVATRAALLGSVSAAAAVALVVACSSPEGASSGGTPPGVDTGAAADALGATDADDAGSDSALPGRCADTFGTALAEGFGRIDGVVYAVQKPSDKTCAMPDPDHLILQVLMEGEVYRMIVNVGVERGGADTMIHIASFPHALPAPEYEEGWRTGIPLDYANILGAHSADGGFAPLTFDDAVARVAAEVKVGDPVSVYAISPPGRPESADSIHRNTPGKNEDGAIVIRPTSGAPTFLLFRTENQVF